MTLIYIYIYIYMNNRNTCCHSLLTDYTELFKGQKLLFACITDILYLVLFN